MFDTPKTKAMAAFLEKEKDRVVGLSIEWCCHMNKPQIWIYTNSWEWCRDDGAGGFWAHSETAAIKKFYDEVKPATDVYSAEELEKLKKSNGVYIMDDEITEKVVDEEVFFSELPIDENLSREVMLTMVGQLRRTVRDLKKYKCVSLSNGTGYLMPDKEVVKLGRSYASGKVAGIVASLLAFEYLIVKNPSTETINLFNRLDLYVRSTLEDSERRKISNLLYL